MALARDPYMGENDTEGHIPNTTYPTQASNLSPGVYYIRIFTNQKAVQPNPTNPYTLTVKVTLATPASWYAP